MSHEKQATADQKKLSADRAAGERNHLSPRQKHERKQRILTQGTSSTTRGIADAIVIKDGNIFFLSDPDGSVPLDDGHGLGLYYNDCRYLNGYELKLADTKPNVLVSSAERGFQAVFQLTNYDIWLDDGRLIPKEEVGVKWTRIIDEARLSVFDTVSFQNFETNEVEFPISFAFRALFEDIFAVRGMLPEKFGKMAHEPAWDDDILRFMYAGADGVYRSLSVHISPKPLGMEGTTATFKLVLAPYEVKTFVVTLTICESSNLDETRPKEFYTPDIAGIFEQLHHSHEEWQRETTSIATDSMMLNRMLKRSLDDVRLLRSSIKNESFYAAGVPWFVTLFGRDSAITALQTLMFDPRIAEGTLRVLAHFQGREVNQWRDEQPGKILHELRVGEMARAGEIPYTPYYGTNDATPLFLILLARYTHWIGNLDLFHELGEHVELALKWMDEYGDSNGDGYVDYKSSSEKGLINQGWKDSGNAMVNTDGSLATPPIALIEVQSYVYLAKLLIADLFQRSGDNDRAGRLRKEADDLRGRVNRDYWLEEKGIYAMALQAGGKPVAVVSSNPGHALWTGIADADKAFRTMERLMAEDMYSGWGVRTLSSNERTFNPVSYHLGSVWPHDNAIIAAGFRAYGFDAEAHRLCGSIIQAATYFKHYRIPELFTGFAAKDYHVPVRYPVACHPQAWGAGTIPYIIEILLGIKPESFDHRLRIVRPLLPDYVDRMTITGLRVGSARVDLRFDRSAEGAGARIIKIEGDLNVIIEL